MPDDEDSKIRRNLIVFCTLIIVTNWLRLPISDLVQILINTKNATGIRLSDVRVWVLLLVIHLYLGLRYKWSSDREKGLSSTREQAWTNYWRLMSKLYFKEMPQSTKGAVYPASFSSTLKSALEKPDSLIAADDSVEKLALRATIRWTGLLPTDRYGLVMSLKGEYSDKSGLPASVNVPVSINQPIAFVLKTYCRIRAHIWSSGSLLYAFPILVWYATLFIIAVQIWFAYRPDSCKILSMLIACPKT